MTHKILELVPVGSKWRGQHGSTFAVGCTFTVTRHDMTTHHIHYVYDNMPAMPKTFDTFELEHMRGSIRAVDVPQSVPCRFQTGYSAPKTSTARLPAQIQEALRNAGGTPASPLSIMMLEAEIKGMMPAGLDFSLKFDSGLRNLTVTLEGPFECYEITEYHVHMAQVPRDGSSSHKKILEEQLKAELRTAKPMKCHVTGLELYIDGKKVASLEGTMLVQDNVETIPKPTMEKPMTRIVNVFLMDKTAGLKAAERMIGKVENFASDSVDNALLLLELSMEHDLKGLLHDHNKRRKAIINQDILNRVGKTVYLQPIELKDVKIDVQVVTAV